MKRFQKVYLEISNLCNMDCSFCPGTNRRPGRLTVEQFSVLLSELRPYTDYLYFHLMGEPLCHPNLREFLELSHIVGFRVILTTNGTLLESCKEILLHAPALHKVNVSLHAFEANHLQIPFADYLHSCFSFGQAASGKPLVVYRLWNQNGLDSRNTEILNTMQQFYPGEWIIERRGTRIGNRVYLEYGEKFDWPDLSAVDMGSEVFCHGLRDQIGVLCDGTVVPCCLDHNGNIALGNLFREPLEQILNSPRAKALYDGFSRRCAPEPLCRRCGYARRFG